MITPSIPSNENERLGKLYSYEILDTEYEGPFDDLAQIAAEVCSSKISLISFIDKNRNWCKSNLGFTVREFSRKISLCAYTILGDDIFEVPDAGIDERFRNYPLHLGPPHVAFYAGAPLVTSDNFNLGAICVIDDRPKKLNGWQKSVLKRLARQVVQLLEGKAREKRLEIASEELRGHKELALKQAKLASIGLIASGVSHEISNPLSVIKGHVSAMEKYLSMNKIEKVKIEKWVKKMGEASERISKILQELRTLSRSDDSMASDFDIQDAVRDACELLREMYQAEGVILKASINLKGPLSIRGSKGRIEQVLINLVANGKDATEGQIERLVEIHLNETEGKAVLKVKDNGKGIPEEVQRNVFDPFFTTKGETKGTGIGLAIVNSIVNEHKGKVYFKSRQNEGTEFFIELPVTAYKGLPR